MLLSLWKLFWVFVLLLSQGNLLYSQSLFGDFFSSGPSFPAGSDLESNVEFSWAEDTKNNYVLTITPKGDKDIPLDIEIQGGIVKVSGKVLKEEVVNRDGGRMRSSYLSQFSLSESIPRGADAEKGKIEQAGKSIKIVFPKSKESSRSSLKDHPKKNKNLRDMQVFGDKI